jgi:hypothetical protein
MAVMARMLFLAAGACVAACGGSEEGGLYSTAKGGAGGAAGTSVGGGAGSGGSASGGAAGMASGGAAGSGASAATGGSGGSGGTGATSSGGGTGGGSGGGSGGGPPGIGTGPCGALSCAFSAGDACCKADGKPLYCSNTKLSNPCKCSGVVCHEIEIKCDGPEDCSAGKVCCAEKGLVSSTWDLLECRETCTSDRVGATRREVCHPGGKACASGTACSPDSALPPGYATCAPK